MAKTLRNDKINKIIYISLGGVVVAIILFIVLFNIFSNKENNMQIGENDQKDIVIEEANSSVGKSIEEAKNLTEEDENESVQVQISDDTQTQQEELSIELAEQENSTIEEDLTSKVNSSSDTNNGTIEQVEQVEKEETPKDPTFTMPVDGEIVKHYGKEKLIYSDTLKEWTTHLGIDIKADKTTIVKSSSDGIVKSIKNDPRYGLTVVVEHGNGFSSVYSNLLTAEFVVTGENVKSGQTLGTVGNSATFEVLDDPHLHFEILKDGVAVDPEMYIK